MKKIKWVLFLLLAISFQACKKEGDFSNSVLKKLQAGHEVVVIQQSDYPADLVSETDGDVLIQIQKDPGGVVYHGADPNYNFNATLKTSSSSPTVTISTGVNNNSYTLSGSGSATPASFKVYNTQNSENNPTYLASYFSKNVTVQISTGAASTAPLSLSLDVPSPILIENIGGDPSVLGANDITNRDIITWASDPNYKNAVIVRVQNYGMDKTYPITTFLTPDDGSLSIADFENFVSKGLVEIEIGRIEYNIVSTGGKYYRFVGIATSRGLYNLN